MPVFLVAFCFCQVVSVFAVVGWEAVFSMGCCPMAVWMEAISRAMASSFLESRAFWLSRYDTRSARLASDGKDCIDAQEASSSAAVMANISFFMLDVI